MIMSVNTQTNLANYRPVMVDQANCCLTLPNRTNSFPEEVSTNKRTLSKRSLFSYMDFMPALMKDPRESPIFLRICSFRNSSEVSGSSIQIGIKDIFAEEIWKPGDHFCMEVKVPLRNQGLKDKIFSTSIS